MEINYRTKEIVEYWNCKCAKSVENVPERIDESFLQVDKQLIKAKWITDLLLSNGKPWAPASTKRTARLLRLQDYQFRKLLSVTFLNRDSKALKAFQERSDQTRYQSTVTKLLELKKFAEVRKKINPNVLGTLTAKDFYWISRMFPGPRTPENDCMSFANAFIQLKGSISAEQLCSAMGFLTMSSNSVVDLYKKKLDFNAFDQCTNVLMRTEKFCPRAVIDEFEPGYAWDRISKVKIKNKLSTKVSKPSTFNNCLLLTAYIFNYLDQNNSFQGSCPVTVADLIEKAMAQHRHLTTFQAWPQLFQICIRVQEYKRNPYLVLEDKLFFQTESAYRSNVEKSNLYTNLRAQFDQQQLFGPATSPCLLKTFFSCVPLLTIWRFELPVKEKITIDQECRRIINVPEIKEQQKSWMPGMADFHEWNNIHTSLKAAGYNLSADTAMAWTQMNVQDCDKAYAVCTTCSEHLLVQRDEIIENRIKLDPCSWIFAHLNWLLLKNGKCQLYADHLAAKVCRSCDSQEIHLAFLEKYSKLIRPEFLLKQSKVLLNVVKSAKAKAATPLMIAESGDKPFAIELVERPHGHFSELELMSEMVKIKTAIKCRQIAAEFVKQLTRKL